MSTQGRIKPAEVARGHATFVLVVQTAKFKTLLKIVLMCPINYFVHMALIIMS